MNISINATKYQLDQKTEEAVKGKLAPVARLLGNDSDMAMLTIEVEEAPPEGRSSEPVRLVARLTVKNGEVYHAEAVKPTPETAADRVRGELESEIKHARGRARRLMERGHAAIKRMVRFGR